MTLVTNKKVLAIIPVFLLVMTMTIQYADAKIYVVQSCGSPVHLACPQNKGMENPDDSKKPSLLTLIREDRPIPTGPKQIGPIRDNQLNEMDVDALAFSPKGLFGFELIKGTDENQFIVIGSQLIQIEEGDAIATRVGDVLDRNMRGATFDFEGKLWATDILHNELVQTDPDTGAEISSVVFSEDLDSMTDMTILPDGRILLVNVTVQGEGEPHIKTFYELDVTTGTLDVEFIDTRPSFDSGHKNEYAGLAYSDKTGKMYAYEANDVVEIYTFRLDGTREVLDVSSTWRDFNTHFPGFSGKFLPGQGDMAVFVDTKSVEDMPPIITLNGELSLTLEVGIDEYTEPGATATDDVDETVEVIIGGDIVDTNTIGIYEITYTATDSSGNEAIKIREINIVDTISPVITLNGASEIDIRVGQDYEEFGAIVSDNDPAYRGIVTIGGDIVDTRILGQYTITYDATSDASNNVSEQVTRSVNIVELDHTLSDIDVKRFENKIENWTQKSDRLEQRAAQLLERAQILEDNGKPERAAELTERAQNILGRASVFQELTDTLQDILNRILS